MYANTCWGLLGLAVAFGLAVLSLPSQYEWLQPWFLGTAVACAVGSIVCFGWPLREKANRVRLIELCIHPYRVLKLIEPSHVIILGLVIALSGVIWQMKFAKPAIAETPGSSSKPNPAVAAAPARALSDFEWGFEKYPGYDFIGMSPDSEQKLLVHFFQAQGHNRTGDPLTKVDGYVRSDRTGRKYPIYFNVPPGATRALPSEINAIPVDAIIDVRAPFLPNDGLMPTKQFLAEIVPFTLNTTEKLIDVRLRSMR